MNPQALERAVREGIQEILGNPSLRGEDLAAAIRALGDRHGIDPFRSCLRISVGLDRPEAEARAALMAIEAHRATFESRLGRDPGFGIAALDYAQESDSSPPSPVPADFDPRSFDEVFRVEVRRAERARSSLTLAILAPSGALDRSGAALEAARGFLHEALRDTDRAARLLPEGLAVVHPMTPAAQGRKAAERLVKSLQTLTGIPWNAGVAASPEIPWEEATLARCALEALGAARARGDQAVAVYRPERREHPRRVAGAGLTAVLQRGGREAVIALEDLSIDGALVETSESLDRGGEVILVLRETCARPREVTIPSRVLRVERSGPPLGRATSRAGLRFLAESEKRGRIAGLLADLRSPQSPRESP